MQSQLVSKLRNKDDLDILKGELDMIENAIYHTDIKYEDVLRSDIRSWVSEIIIRESEGQDLGSYVKKLRDDIVGVPILSASIFCDGLPGVKLSEIVIFENDEIGQVFSTGRNLVEIIVISKGYIKVGTKVARTGQTLKISVGDGLFGNIVSPP